MVQHSGPEPDPSRDTGHAVAVGNRERSSWASRFGAVGATRSQARSPARRSPRDSRNIAVALALLAFAVIMFLVTIVKFEEQIQRIDMSQTRGAPPPPVRALAARKNLLGPSIWALPGCEVPCRRLAFQGELF